MRILYLCADPGIPVRGHKGAAVHVRALCAAFGRAGHAVTLIAAKIGPADGPQPAARVIDASGVDEGAGTGPSAAARVVTRSQELLATESFDFVYERYALWSAAGSILSKTTGLPLVLVSPLLGLQYGLDGGAIGVLVLSLLVGTPVLSLLGAVAAALALGLRGAGVLTALIVLPLNAPLLIFGSGVVQAQMSGLPVDGLFSVLGALLALGLVTVPFALAQAIRIACE